MKRRVLAAMAVGFLLALTGGGVAVAAPTYLSSQPADGAKVHKPPKQVSITFSEPIDASSTMTVRDHCGRTLDNGNVQIELNEMRVGIAKTPAGHYIVTYSAVGLAGLTGSTKGTFGFRVHAGKSCTGLQHQGHKPRTTGHQKHQNGTGQEHEMHPPGSTTEEHPTEHAAGMNQGHAKHQGDHSKHDAGRKHGNKREHGDHVAQGDEPQDEFQTQALERGETPIPDIVPGSEAVIAALAAAAALGAFGGWILRTSPPGH